MKKLAEWRIKTKKDWILAFLFTALMVYVVAVRFFHWKILNFMQKFMPDEYHEPAGGIWNGAVLRFRHGGDHDGSACA